MTRRLVLAYLGAFTIVLLAFNVAVYWHFLSAYRETLGPALATAEGQAGLNLAMRRILIDSAVVDAPLLALIALVSTFLARTTIDPLMRAREREARFAADAAHELRTPLATIAAIAQAADAHAPAGARAALDRIAALAVEASALIGDLLTLTRAEHAHALATEPLDLGALLGSVAAEFRERNGPRPHLQFESGSAIVDGDERRLLQVLRNLLDNAGRHARERVSARVWQEGSCAFVAVEDDGAGVPPELQASIFERFVRGSDDGTGLGLAICRWVAHAHGGEISLDPPSRFVLRLPLLQE